MTEVRVPYGDKEICVDIPKENLIGIIDPIPVEKRNEEHVVNESLRNPISHIEFSRFIKNGRILFIVNDADRPTPTKKILDAIWDKIKDTDFEFIVATGSHREPSREELEEIFGIDRFGEIGDRIHIHKSRDDEFEFLGKTSKGTEFLINKRVMEFDKLININSLEPHYFTGYTGGRKSFLPGSSSYKTIEQNHRFALDKNAITCKLENNPVHEDMTEAVSILEKKKSIFSINIVNDNNKDIYDSKSGDWRGSFLRAVKSCKKIYCVPIKERADIVITVAQRPLDKNLYQSQKALENGKMALKRDGYLILVSKCDNGIGPSEFYNLLEKSDIPEELFNEIKDNYKLGYHKAAKFIDLATWAKMCAITDLNDKIVRNCFMTPFKDLQDAIDNAIEEKGKDAKILMLRNGAVTVPLLS
ncbi:MAG: nickel-dependent lactate racemase [Candidatus Altiarchaeales archaeon]|nr:MAG: nickel-dependent lactate racemase [Candidatus Altiarchaeales archaeon]